ncbi:MAG TPA: GGDEF domain-containing protein [Solirubrobacterales bacterium]|nr:GGDEF domain-containing protein [Solirubrobacterales bacterium]
MGIDGGGPPRDLVLAALFVVAGLLGIFAAIFPLSDQAPTALASAIGVVSIIVGGTLLIPHEPYPVAVLRIYTISAILALSYLIANTNTELGAMLSSIPYLWFCVYFGAFFEPREARLQILLICVCFGIALLVSGVVESPSFWVLYTATIIITTEALLASNHALRIRARQDPLTGLLNRRGFEDSIEPILALTERAGKPTSLIVIDLDGFKAINDSLGHLEGDRILARLANSWMEIKRESDLVARFGGDEFIVALPLTSNDEAMPMVDRFAAADPVSWSYGMVEVDSRDRFTLALRRADRALYDAKEAR